MRLKNFLLSAGVCALVAGSFGCGASDSSRLSGIGSSHKAPVFFVVGGRRSCQATPDNSTDNPRGTGLFKALKPILDKLATETGQEPEYFSACHYNGAEDMAYASSWDQDVQYGKTEAEVREEILKRRSQIEESQAILIGHSYGGWVVMSLASKFTTGQAFGQFYTIDAISKVRCTPTQPLGCQSAPQDIGNADRNHIADTTDLWHNYFQTTTKHLHSSSMSQADTNSQSDLAHKQIDEDPKIWREIHSNVLRDLLN